MKKIIPDYSELWLIISKLRQEGKKIIFTTGVFDAELHEGHLKYLKLCKELGGILFVGIHSDNLTKERKGLNRPLLNENIRARNVLSVDCVDYVFIIPSQGDVYTTIDDIKPDILAVSETTKDYANSPKTMIKLFGEDMEVITFPAQSDIHTSDLFSK